LVHAAAGIYEMASGLATNSGTDGFIRTADSDGKTRSEVVIIQIETLGAKSATPSHQT